MHFCLFTQLEPNQCLFRNALPGDFVLIKTWTLTAPVCKQHVSVKASTEVISMAMAGMLEVSHSWGAEGSIYNDMYVFNINLNGNLTPKDDFSK